MHYCLEAFLHRRFPKSILWWINMFELEEGTITKILILGVAAAIALYMVSQAYAGIPAPPGLGEPAANVKFIVSGTWVHVSIPAVPDTITIKNVQHQIIGWGYYLTVLPTGDSLNIIDTSKAKIVYEVWDSSNNRVVTGNLEFDLTSAWQVEFIVRGLKPNTYTLRIFVFQYADGWPWTGWYERTSYEYSFTIQPPQNV